MEIMATNKQKQQIHRLKRQYGWDEDTYRGLISQYSGGRTTSSKELSKREASSLIRKFLGVSPDYERPARLELVKAIYAVSLEISFLNKGYASDDPVEKEMNKAKINKFVCTRGVVRKPISQQNYEELKETLKQFKKISEREK